MSGTRGVRDDRNDHDVVTALYKTHDISTSIEHIASSSRRWQVNHIFLLLGSGLQPLALVLAM